MREPDPARHPAGLLEEIDRPQAIHVKAELLLVVGLAEMGVKLAVVRFREPCAVDHQALVDRERRTGRERDADPRAGIRIVEQLQDPLAVGEDRVLVLHHAVGRQAAVLFRPVHRAARHRHPHAEAKRLLDGDVDRVLEPGRIEVMVVRRRRAAGKQEFGQRHPHRETQVPRLQPRPDRIEGGQPGKQLLVDRVRDGRASGSERNDDAR